MSSRARLVVFVVVILACGMLIGSLTLPGPWYDALNKPWFNLPNWVFAPAWTVLYVLIGIAGWRVWDRARALSLKILWVLQLVVNFSWTPVFFRAQRTDLALVVVLSLLVLVVAFIGAAWRRDRIAARLFVPYAAWVAFASLLNAAILVLN